MENKRNSKKFANVAAALLTVAQVAGTIALCTGGGGGAGGAINSIINVVCEVFKYVGAGILVLGIAKFALALKDENGPGQSQAILYAVAGGVLIGIDVLVGMLDLGI